MSALLDLFYPYDSPPDEDNFEFANEDIILQQLDEQFQVRDVNFNKNDLFKKYAYDILHIDIETYPLYKFEIPVNSDDNLSESFDYFMSNVIAMFKKYFGIDMEDMERDIADFEFLYELYNIFILDLNKTMAHFMNGVRSTFNLSIQHPEEYTLVGCYKDYLREQSVEEFKNSDTLLIENMINTMSKEENIVDNPVNRDSIDIYVNSAKAFNDLYEKIIENDNIFDIDTFFEVIRYSDDNETYQKLDAYTSDGSLPIDVPLLKQRIKQELILPENMEDLENRYRKLIKTLEDDTIKAL